jgi:hypothetical protein
MKTNRNKLRCLNCDHQWFPRKKSPRRCPLCHRDNFELYTEFSPLKDKIRPKQFPYRKNWGKPRKSVMYERSKGGDIE